MKQTKKGILGLNTIKTFIVVMLALAIVAVVALVILGSFNTTSFISQTGVKYTGTYTNETLQSVVNADGAYTLIGSYPNVAQTCSVTACRNASNGAAIATANWTATNCLVKYTNTSTDVGGFINVLWKCDYTYSYNDGRQAAGIISNVSSGVSGFFGNSTTFFSLLGVVVIILIISLVVVVVNRFGGQTMEGSSGGGIPSSDSNL
jgi:hypothetical protein